MYIIYISGFYIHVDATVAKNARAIDRQSSREKVRIAVVHVGIGNRRRARGARIYTYTTVRPKCRGLAAAVC